jgi:hypothetical protein
MEMLELYTRLMIADPCQAFSKNHRCYVYDSPEFPLSSLKLTCLQTPEREQEELNQYDAKVYRACKAMVESQTSSLKVLGVPFFGVKPNLILHESEDALPTDVVEAQSGTAGNKLITKVELRELQQKMLNHMMELYGD